MDEKKNKMGYKNYVKKNFFFDILLQNYFVTGATSSLERFRISTKQRFKIHSKMVLHYHCSFR
jgi:hypothetical protein